MKAIEEVHSELDQFSLHYGYDAGYLKSLAGWSPEAFDAFQAAQPLGHVRRVLSLEAHFIVRIVAMQAEDCGACAQLSLKMAVEAGVSRDLLRDLLEEPARLPELLRDLRHHVLTVVGQLEVDPERLQRLTAEWGQEGLAEIAVNIAGSRLYPTLKRGLGMQTSCEKLHLDF